MQPIKRKRVSQVGSGAWSIYLPKKWIDSWTKEQKATREVDLHLISGRLLIVPALEDNRFEATVNTGQELIQNTLRSAYVQGYDQVVLKPQEGPFDNDAITGARDLLRHLDERLVATVGADAIGFEAQRGLGAPTATGTDLLRLMSAKAIEVLDLAAECVDQSGSNPERALHAARLLQSIHQEDLARLYHQTLRRVATLDLPLDSVTDFQLLDLTAFLLNNIGAQCVQVAGLVLGDLGLTLADLAFPRADLLKRLPRSTPPPPVARDMLQGHRAAFRDAHNLLERTMQAILTSATDEFSGLTKETMQARFAQQERLFEAVVRHWGDESSKAMAARGFAAYQLANPISNVFGAIASIIEQATTFAAARREVPA